MEFSKLLKFALLSLFLTQAALAGENDTFNFVNNRTVYIRDSNLNDPQPIPANSTIGFDVQFLLEVFRTTNPTREQVQRLFLNPGEFYGRIDARTYTSQNGHRYSDYFFPVVVTTPSGETKTGEMSLFTYNRAGYVELQQGPRLKAPPRKTEGSAPGCSTCGTPPPGNTSDLTSIIAVGRQNSRNSSNPLWQKYREFAVEFSKAHKNITKSQAGYYKRLYVKTLIEKLGAQEAGLILTAVTGFAESPSRNAREVQVAESAAIIKVINNRANNRYRKRSRTLRDIGISESADDHLTNVLADWQFSVWNEQDNSLTRILNLNPDTADSTTMNRLTSAFDAQYMIDTGKVQFQGGMNNNKLQHYHANYVLPNWAVASKRVPGIVRVEGQDIDISRQRGATHIFYAGIP